MSAARLRVTCMTRCCRSLQELFVVMVVLASFSTLLTYQIGTYLPWSETREVVLKEPHPRWPDTGGGLNVPQPKQQQKLEGHHNHRHLSQASKSAQILTKLLQIEDQLMSVSHRRKVLVMGSNDSFVREAAVLKRAFQDNDLKMEVRIDKDEAKQEFKTDIPISKDWSMIWCLPGRDNCSSILSFKYLFQMVNRIPAIARHLMVPSKLCHIQTSLHTLLDYSPPFSTCTVQTTTSVLTLPHYPKSLGSPIEYAIKPAKSKLEDVVIIKSLPEKELNIEVDTVVWTSPRGFLSVGNNSLSLRLSVLVSSLSPLRLYLHPMGLMGSPPTKVHNIILTMRRLIAQEHGQSAARKWWLNLQRTLVTLLLTTEYGSYERNNTKSCGCSRCFQLLDIDTVFTTNFQPIILQIKEPVSSIREVMEDSVAIVAAKERVAMDVASALDDVGQDVFLNNQDCAGSFGVCLTDHDLVYLLDNKRESQASTQFYKLYPHMKTSQYSGLIHKLRQVIVQSRSSWPLHTITGIELSANNIQSNCHVTSDLHSLLASMENRYVGDEGGLDVLDKGDIIRPFEPSYQPLKKSTSSPDMKKQECSNDLKDVPYLSSIHTYPTISLSPTFDPGHMTYQAEVDYDTILLRVWAKAKHCKYEARVESIYSSPGQRLGVFIKDDSEHITSVTNYTLGLGENLVHIIVVGSGNSQPFVVSTYTISIRRRTSDFYLPEYSPNLPLVTCTLKQDCSLRYSPSEPCGLQPVTGKGQAWSGFTAMSNHLPQCGNKAQAAWYVPCNSCSQINSCYWKEARWQSPDCMFKFLGVPEVKKCLSGKKLMFIGDSTNRGILHYIVEKVNGTLTHWDKTHNLKIYTNINNNSTVLSFTYYPQFWLPTDHRPAFDKAVYQLIRSTLPLENTTNTVLVVGGVHWLGKQHLSLILKALQRESLTGIRLVMKGLGAGFHQLLQGVRFAPMDEQRRLLSQEADTSNFAVSHGFRVVPTFNMTMARYKDFLQGKCACHFHKVTERFRSPSDEQPTYHVDGDINNLYSELVLNQICQNQAPD